MINQSVKQEAVKENSTYEWKIENRPSLITHILRECNLDNRDSSRFVPSSYASSTEL